eukprot:11200821-Lingulodinium_polyedra.AAC.1
MLRGAFENWESLQIMHIRGNEVTLHPPSAEGHVAVTIPYGPAAQVARAISLRSFFDGTGVAR